MELFTKMVVFVMVALGAILLYAIIGMIVAFPVMWLWNAVVPDIFHLRRITWSDAWILYMLASILVRSSSGRNSKSCECAGE